MTESVFTSAMSRTPDDANEYGVPKPMLTYQLSAAKECSWRARLDRQDDGLLVAGEYSSVVAH
jgi:hypothetical protein